jgi:hypothetical protein
MTEPQEETPETLLSFLEKEHFPTSNMYMFADSASCFWAFRDPVFSKNLLTHMIFDRNDFLLNRDTTKCQWAGGDFIRSLQPDSTYGRWNGLLLSDVTSRIVPFGKEPDTTRTANSNPDFTIVITWSKFLGKYNYRLFSLADTVSQNKKSSIRMIYLNLDMQKDWHLRDDQKMKME